VPGDPIPHPIAALELELLSDVVTTLEAHEAKPGRFGLVHGEPAFDECCVGFAWSRFLRVYTYRNWPNELHMSEKCAVGLAAVYELGIVRCVPTLTTGRGGKDVLPKAQDLENSAIELADDALWLMQSALSTTQAWQTRRRAFVSAVEPVSPNGECAGSMLTVTAQLV
jgi:hypothetical protein